MSDCGTGIFHYNEKKRMMTDLANARAWFLSNFGFGKYGIHGNPDAGFSHAALTLMYFDLELTVMGRTFLLRQQVIVNA